MGIAGSGSGPPPGVRDRGRLADGSSNTGQDAVATAAQDQTFPKDSGGLPAAETPPNTLRYDDGTPAAAAAAAAAARATGRPARFSHAALGRSLGSQSPAVAKRAKSQKECGGALAPAVRAWRPKDSCHWAACDDDDAAWSRSSAPTRSEAEGSNRP